MKKLLFIGYNFSPELTGIGKYSGEMMHWLAKKGHDCTVLTSYPYYPYWKIQEPYRKHRFWFKKEVKNYDSNGKLSVIRCPMYVPNRPSGLKRIILDTTFTISAFLAIIPLLFQRKHDWVISVAPSFQFGLLGVFYKKLKGAKHWHHIQDLQIEAAQDLGIIKSNKLLSILYGIEKTIFKNTDTISSISNGMIDRIERKAKMPLLLFPNWTDTSNFYPMENKSKLKKQFGFTNSDWVVLYSGAIGEKQGLEAILQAAKTLKHRNTIQFVICGTGPYKENLKILAKEMVLENIHFMPLQPKDQFNAFLNMADLHLVIQKEKASDLVMPSKLTTILAVGGHALVTANKTSSLYQLLKTFKMGQLVTAEDSKALAEGILKAYESQNNNTIKLSARAYAEKHLEINNVMTSFVGNL